MADLDALAPLVAQLADSIADAVTSTVPGTTSYRAAVAVASVNTISDALTRDTFARALARALTVDTP